MADAPVGDAPEPVAAPRMTARRLLGFDRSGPPPPQTLAGAPWNPWTIPNLIVALRFALIPLFLVVALSSGDGTTVAGALLYLGLALSDYADGMAARVTGQYSRLGALIDPLVDRLLVISGVLVCWHFETLPRWALALLIAREVLMLALGQVGLRRGVELRINWPGRIGVWWVLGAPFWAMLGLQALALIYLYVGLGFTIWATALYLRDGITQLRARPSSGG